MPNELLSVTDAIQLPPETWINNGVRGVVSEIKTVPKRAGGNFWKIRLADQQHPQATIDMSAFAYPKYQQGDVLEITGKGIMRGDYQGSPELKVGKDAQIRSSGKSAEAVLESIRRPTPPQSAPQPYNAPISQGNTPSGQTAIHGATVGGAISRSVEVLLATRPDVFKTDSWRSDVYALSVGFCDIQQAIESGKPLPDADQVPY